MAFASKCAIVAVTLFALVLMQGGGGGGGAGVVDARRNQGTSQRKTSSSSSNSGHVTQPSYNSQSNSGGNSHADVAKLSYPNYNSQPNRPANNPAPAGWNVPQGPPPAYSAANPAGGARPNVHEPPPAYHAPNYGAAPGSNMHPNPNYGGQQAGAPYHPSGGYPAGGYPSGGYSAGGYPSGGYHAAAPPGATYYQAGSALPPGATLYAQPPQQSSSGLGFGTGLLAGGLGGALIGHALTPSGGSSYSQPMAAAPAAAGGQDRIIIINNGVPTVVNATDGVTVINSANGTVEAAHGAPMNATQMDAAAPQPAQLAPMMPMANVNGSDPAAAAGAPPPGGIICVPTKMNETDPADSSKMIEVEKIACYPAPQQQPAAPGSEPVPLAPMATGQPPAVIAPAQAAVRSNDSGAAASGQMTLLPALVAAAVGLLLRHAALNN